MAARIDPADERARFWPARIVSGCSVMPVAQWSLWISVIV
jgi:hypothetical protein